MVINDKSKCYNTMASYTFIVKLILMFITTVNIQSIVKRNNQKPLEKEIVCMASHTTVEDNFLISQNAFLEHLEPLKVKTMVAAGK